MLSIEIEQINYKEAGEDSRSIQRNNKDVKPVNKKVIGMFDTGCKAFREDTVLEIFAKNDTVLEKVKQIIRTSGLLNTLVYGLSPYPLQNKAHFDGTEKLSISLKSIGAALELPILKLIDNKALLSLTNETFWYKLDFYRGDNNLNSTESIMFKHGIQLSILTVNNIKFSIGVDGGFLTPCGPVTKVVQVLNEPGDLTLSEKLQDDVSRFSRLFANTLNQNPFTNLFGSLMFNVGNDYFALSLGNSRFALKTLEFGGKRQEVNVLTFKLSIDLHKIKYYIKDSIKK